MVGGKDDFENGIISYENISYVGDPHKCRFIGCFDFDEFDLMPIVFSNVYKTLGAAAHTCPNVFRFTTEQLWLERSGGCCADTNNVGCRMLNGRSYGAYGNTESKSSFNIHILGTCLFSETHKFMENTVSKLLYQNLQKTIKNVTVHSWGQPARPVYDNIISLIRDVNLHKPDLVILFMTPEDFNPLYVVTKNLLAVRTANHRYHSTDRIDLAYNNKVNNGINHDIEISQLGLMQNKVFLSLAKYFGFTFCKYYASSPDLISEAKAMQFLGLSSKYFERCRKRKDEYIKTVNSPCVKDYSDTFNEVEDIFNVYSDAQHFSQKGNELIAKRLADDITLHFNSK